MKKYGINKKSLIRLFGMLRKRWVIYFITLFLLSCVFFVYQFGMALGLKGLTDASVAKDMHALIVCVIEVAIVFVVLTFLLLPISVYFFISTIEKVHGDIQKELISHIQRLPLEYFESRHSGDVITKTTSDLNNSINVFYSMRPLSASLVSSIGSGITIFALNWELGVVAITLGVLKIWVNASYIKILRKLSKEVQEKLSVSVQKISDIVSGIVVIKVFRYYQSLGRRFLESCMQIQDVAIQRARKNAQLDGINAFFDFMNFSGMLIIGCVLVYFDKLTFGTLIAIIQLMNGLFAFFTVAGNLLTGVQSGLVSADRYFEILDTPVECYEVADVRKGVEEQKNTSCEIQLKKLEFAYDRSGQRVIDGLNIQIQRGSYTAIVGASGCGKSTLFKLLLGFYQKQSGEIIIRGRKMSDYSLKELRKLIAYVPQECYLFHGTIYENIAYGNYEATKEQVLEAAKIANAHEFIVSLTDGYETNVGEMGAKLSGGQRQRIAIARAVLKDAPILLLDEATSSLDVQAEQQVQCAIENLTQGRTTLVIAHRLKTIQKAGRILVMREGNICEEGSHEELMQKHGDYYDLYTERSLEIEA